MISKIKKHWYYIALFVLVIIIIYIRYIPIETYSYATSGCTGLESASYETVEYRIIGGDRNSFYSDKEAVPESSFQFLAAACATDTKTHELFIL